MLTVHIAGKPENLLQKCFRCNRVLIDNRRVLATGKEGQLFYWTPGAFVGAYDSGNGSAVRDRDADESNSEERACECPDTDVAVGQLMPGAKGPFQ